MEGTPVSVRGEEDGMDALRRQRVRAAHGEGDPAKGGELVAVEVVELDGLDVAALGGRGVIVGHERQCCGARFGHRLDTRSAGPVRLPAFNIPKILIRGPCQGRPWFRNRGTSSAESGLGHMMGRMCAVAPGSNLTRRMRPVLPSGLASSSGRFFGTCRRVAGMHRRPNTCR